MMNELHCLAELLRAPELYQAKSAVLFGSRAADVSDHDSDWDILLVGVGRTALRRHASLVWVAEADLGAEHWLGSELAGHIAHYGVPLRGDASWRLSVRLGQHALARKQQRIISRARALISRARHPATYQVLVPRLRRDLQRYACLLQNRPVPPRQLLDLYWERSPNWRLLANQPGLEPASHGLDALGKLHV